jgi:hypothetical protein
MALDDLSRMDLLLNKKYLILSFYPFILLSFYPFILLSFYPFILLSFYPFILLSYLFFKTYFLSFYSSSAYTNRMCLLF